MSLFEMLNAAGPLLWVLLVLSLYVLYLFLLRFQQLHKMSADPTITLIKVHSALVEQDIEAALHEAKKHSSPAAHVLWAGLERSPFGIDSASSAMSDAQLLEEKTLFAGLNTLGTIAQIAPLLGLMGTVFGMIRSFVVFASTSAPTANQLAAGISEALINTAGGLVVAVSAYIFRSILRTKADGIAFYVDRVREVLPAWLTETRLRGEGLVAYTATSIGLFDPQIVQGQNEEVLA